MLSAARSAIAKAVLVFITVSLCLYGFVPAASSSAAPAPIPAPTARHKVGLHRPALHRSSQKVKPVFKTLKVATPATAGTDAGTTLSALAVGGSVTSLAPGFNPAIHVYEVLDTDADSFTLTPTVGAAGAQAVVRVGTTEVSQTSGTATVPLVRGRNDVTVTVTSADQSATAVYHVVVWRLAAPTSRIVSLSHAHDSVFGGSRVSVTIADGQLPAGCDRHYEIGGPYAPMFTSTFDPRTGLTVDDVGIPSRDDRKPGKYDLVLVNNCWGPGWGFNVTSSTTAANAITYAAGLTVDSISAPAVVTAGSVFDIRGTNVNDYSDAVYWLSDAAGNTNGNLWPWSYSGNDRAQVLVDYSYGNPFYASSGPRTLHVGYCPPDYEEGDSTADCTTVASKTVNWVASTPTDLSFSPSSGPTAGGTVIRLRGRFITSGPQTTTIKVGDQTVPTFTRISTADWGYTAAEYTQGLDVVEFAAPASAVTGAAPITVTTEDGTGTARGLFTYSAKPTITGLTPASVANSGGSRITITGTGFGTTGSPAVIVNGVKSPSVTRVSSTKVTAIVPAATGSTGPVDVSVLSTQGGGVSDPATLTLTAPGTAPTVTKVTPVSGKPGDTVTLTGTGFGPAGTIGVSVGSEWAAVSASTATSVTFDIPATATTGAQDVTVGSVTGAVTLPHAFTIVADPGINAVTPATIPSYATGAAAKVALDGAGFGAKGTVQVGSGKAVAYAATASGTHIAGVVVPTTAAGVVPIVVTPAGSTTALRASVTVTAPVLTYVGPDPREQRYGAPDTEAGRGGYVLETPTKGGAVMRVEGTGFGPSGVVTVAGTPVTTTSWTDTAIVFTVPAHAAGTASITVRPTHSTLMATRADGVRYIVAPVGPPVIGTIASINDNGFAGRNEFDPQHNAAQFILGGANLIGTNAAKTRIVISDNTQTLTVTPTLAKAGSLEFDAPRGLTTGGWKDLQVVTDIGTADVNYGIYYHISAGAAMVATPYTGLCRKTDVTATGNVTYHPAEVSLDTSEDKFGATQGQGTVTVAGVLVTPTSWTANHITFSMAGLSAELDNPWGWKRIVVTPNDSSAEISATNFGCFETPSVTTTANGSASALTVAAGTAYTLGYTTTGFVDPGFTATAPTGYEYVSAADFGTSGFGRNVQAGVPSAAGDWYVRVALGRATFRNEAYLPFTPAAVHVTITGTPVTVGAASDNGANFTYKGQLGDGTDGTSHDVHYTAAPQPADPITKVFWQYRDSQCDTDPTKPWTDGLPSHVARSSTACGGNGITVSSWDVRVKSFEMTASGTDRAGFYLPTFDSVRITINPRSLTIAKVRADKPYDGTTAAPLGALEVTGAVAGDDVALADAATTATFADAIAGTNKPVTLSQDLKLAGSAQGDYTLADASPTIVGTISKASAVLSLTADRASVLLTQNTPVHVTAVSRNAGTNAPVDDTAAPIVLVSKTPNVCTISGTTVTAVTAGTCTIAATQAGSPNYSAATAASDPSSLTETVDIKVFGAARTIQVVADDLTVAQGDPIDPTSEVSGLFDGDSIDAITYDYYAGSTLLTGAPTTPGTYKVVPHGGTLHTEDSSAYSNPTAFGYVAGKLIITAAPPVIGQISPLTGPVAGGNKVTITGTLLDTVTAVKIGSVTLRRGDFTVNTDGTSLTFTTPRVSKPGAVDLILVAGTASAQDIYTYVANIVHVPGAPTAVQVSAGNGRLTVTFTPPASDGGAPITGYQVSTDGGHTWHRAVTVAGPGGTRIASVAGLHNGSRYAVRVRAVNSAGAGTASPAVTGRPEQALRLPSAPRKAKAVGTDRGVRLTFLAPATNGGTAVTGYQVSVDGGRTWQTVPAKEADGALAATVTGLDNGVRYRVRVRAVNAKGAGPSVSAGTVVPNAAPLGSKRPRRSGEIAVPAHPSRYHGPRAWTVARNTSHNGTWAHPISTLGARQLTVGEAATLDKSSLFEFDSAVLTADGRAAVRLLAGHLRLAHAVNCEGYTDYAGAAAHELDLSQRRAVAVCEALVRFGAHVTFHTHGYGDSRPVIVGGSAQSRAANRRVVVMVTR